MQKWGIFMVWKNLKVKNLIMLTLAGLINAFGVTFFLYPVNLYDSGVSGTNYAIIPASICFFDCNKLASIFLWI